MIKLQYESPWRKTMILTIMVSTDRLIANCTIMLIQNKNANIYSGYGQIGHPELPG